jgi:hypothetical protein
MVIPALEFENCGLSIKNAMVKLQKMHAAEYDFAVTTFRETSPLFNVD